MHSQINFGYPWWLEYGHLVFVAILLPLLILAIARKWSKVLIVLVGAVTLWATAAFFVARFGLNVNGRLALPTEKFLASGEGKVLDMGAGTGRSTIMVLEARPKTTVVALDLFTDSFEAHFGGDAQTGQQRLLANLKAAGVDQRATIVAADMRKLPFETASFDGIVSTYAIDHLNRDGITASLKEASRVLKPGGEFLMMVIYKDGWLTFTFGPLLLHSGTRKASGWSTLLNDAGLQVMEQGTVPATLYVLARKQ